ncbi:cellulose biosynthesis protein BcsO [Kosakonia sp. MUSA4]|uniref:cellulose biosynthesis protein BcsO n=1 Tax=Kosakonia sp. MUSA4 TaxID=2067958 RepID=UPI001597A317|nr:cellulose biosynthesis protein BcsO [Kosakonia sp. MUSA4]QJT83157.1 cellulose biosynthesis protein BcsO [Kosakonia sp. MUSA4]
MNHYDDLQRFKDKTRNQKHNFKDLSAQNPGTDQGNWALIQQLSPATDESTLTMGGHVSLPVPQSIEPDLFARPENAPAADVSEPASIPAPSIFQAVASQIAAVIPPPAPVSIPTPVRALPAEGVKSAAVNYAQLFAAKAPEAKPKTEKNQPLHSLLERIASCR